MSHIRGYIDKINRHNKKALAVFLTAGYPNIKDFVTLSKEILQAGADIFEIGIPFSDPIADGPVIQRSSQIALEQGVDLQLSLELCEQIQKSSDKPVILMGYANPIIKYGIVRFIEDAKDSGVSGLIIPDVPLEEFDDFWGSYNHDIDIILLTTPTSSAERIKKIDARSSGFVYCVSLTGTTGVIDIFTSTVSKNLQRTYKLIKNNKMLVGFGISKPSDIIKFAPFCDGVIVGSAVIKRIMEDQTRLYQGTIDLIRKLSRACLMR